MAWKADEECKLTNNSTEPDSPVSPKNMEGNSYILEFPYKKERMYSL